MTWFRQLRWKLLLSHLLIIFVGVVVLLGTGYFLSAAPLAEPASPNTLAPDTTQTISPSELAPETSRPVLEQAMLIAAFAALAAAVVVSYYVSRRIVEPLQELALVTRRLALGYYRERTSIQSDDELADLSASINHLAEALEKTEQRRLSLIADVAHELRTPLATIEGYMEGLIDNVIAPEAQTFAMLQHEATRLKWLIEELALLSRAEAGQLRIEQRSVALPKVIEHVAAQFQPQFAAQEIALQLEVPPVLNVLADPDRIEQVLINLLANAVQYTPNGGCVTISAQAQEFLARIAVRDTGIGIPSEHLPHIFERFYRVDKSRARLSGGTGIGLTIARHLVYAHGGEIWAESDGPGRGTTFYFTLPVPEAAIASVR